jgi:hypothetical protein
MGQQVDRREVALQLKGLLKCAQADMLGVMEKW